MCLDHAEWAEFHLRMTMLTDNQLSKLALHFEENSITPIDKEHHRIVKIVIDDRAKGRERDVMDY